MNNNDSSITPAITLREAQQRFYRDNGFPPDGGVSRSHWAPMACRDLKVHLPNFDWRKKAIPIHDLHHIITGYEFSPRGEFQMAAWEFAAGRYPSAYSTLFCLPLVSMGAAVSPRRTLAAFVLGRRSRTLYAVKDFDGVLDRTVMEMRREILPAGKVVAGFRDYWTFALLVSASALLTLSPIAVAVAFYLARS